MDLERELTRVLRGVSVSPSGDPVPAVHAGMRRRRRRQRVQALSTSLAVVAVAVTGTLLVRRSDSAAPVVPVAPTPTVEVTGPPADPTAVPFGFAATSLSFITVDDGWALGTAPCGLEDCVVELVTQDGGTTWVRRPARGLPRACTPEACVRQVRFADARVGYAFGPSLYVTGDGGKSWTRQPVGGEVAGLEIAGGTVVRAVQQCAPGCPQAVQVSDVGSFAWRTTWSQQLGRAGLGLVRQGDRVVVRDEGHRAGGADDAHTRLLRSTDGGETFSEQADPCDSGAAARSDNSADEVDGVDLSLGPSGTSALLCQYRLTRGDLPTEVRFSVDGGRTYSGAQALPRLGLRIAAVSPGRAVVEAIRGDEVVLLLSEDDGATWREVASQHQPDGPVGGFLAFSTPTVGTWVGGDGSYVWRTSDGGATWTAHAFRR